VTGGPKATRVRRVESCSDGPVEVGYVPVHSAPEVWDNPLVMLQVIKSDGKPGYRMCFNEAEAWELLASLHYVLAVGPETLATRVSKVRKEALLDAIAAVERDYLDKRVTEGAVARIRALLDEGPQGCPTCAAGRAWEPPEKHGPGCVHVYSCRFPVEGKPCGKKTYVVARGGEYPLYPELCREHYDKLDESQSGWKEKCYEVKDPFTRRILREVDRAFGDFSGGPRESEGSNERTWVKLRPADGFFICLGMSGCTQPANGALCDRFGKAYVFACCHSHLYGDFGHWRTVHAVLDMEGREPVLVPHTATGSGGGGAAPVRRSVNSTACGHPAGTEVNRYEYGVLVERYCGVCGARFRALP
jgi:hypothetical protein